MRSFAFNTLQELHSIFSGGNSRRQQLAATNGGPAVALGATGTAQGASPPAPDAAQSGDATGAAQAAEGSTAAPAAVAAGTAGPQTQLHWLRPQGYQLPAECIKHEELYSVIFDLLRPWFVRGITKEDFDACAMPAGKDHKSDEGWVTPAPRSVCCPVKGEISACHAPSNPFLTQLYVQGGAAVWRPAHQACTPAGWLT
jgi:hypothetical protein